MARKCAAEEAAAETRPIKRLVRGVKPRDDPSNRAVEESAETTVGVADTSHDPEDTQVETTTKNPTEKSSDKQPTKRPAKRPAKEPAEYRTSKRLARRPLDDETVEDVAKVPTKGPAKELTEEEFTKNPTTEVTEEEPAKRTAKDTGDEKSVKNSATKAANQTTAKRSTRAVKVDEGSENLIGGPSAKPPFESAETHKGVEITRREGRSRRPTEKFGDQSPAKQLTEKATKATKQTPTKRPSRAAKTHDDPVWCTTNPKSGLVTEDLHAKYSDPQTYAKWTKKDWEEARANLPDDAPYDDDGYSVPMAYFKYNPDWRRVVREWQEDLGAGRYEPAWLEAAAQAMEERANGDFDGHKEEQFESFWGQKQKLPSTALAGESTNIKLQELAENGVFKVGDCFSYARVIASGPSKIMIEKEAKIVKIEGGALTLAIPPGQLKYARRISQAQGTQGPDDSSQNGPADDDTAMTGDHDLDVQMEGGETSAGKDDDNDLNGDKGVTAQTSSSNTKTTDGGTATGDTTTVHDAELEVDRALTSDAAAGPPNVLDESIKTQAPDTDKPTNADVAGSPPNREHEISAGNSDALKDDVILASIISLTELEKRFIDIDGRLSSTQKETRPPNSWKAMRGKRNNQDLGTLFEMREDYFVWKHPKIVKTPQETTRK